MPRALLPLALLALTACAHIGRSTDVAPLLDAEQAVFAAIAARDETTLRRLIAEDFRLRVPGQPDADLDGFVTAIRGIPGRIVSVDGERLEARRWGDVGMVSGVQRSRVELDGQTVEDRGGFVDVFELRGGRWLMTYAFSVPLAAPAAGGE
jgi:hypothetical protein